MLAHATDHIAPHRGNPDLFWNEANWQPLCKVHHDRKTLTQDVAPRHRPEDLPTPRCRVILVCGPPMSGKTAYIAAHAASEDIVIEGDPPTGDRAAVAAFLRARNTALAQLSLEPAWRTAWVALSAAIRARAWWERALAADSVVVLNPSRAECEARARADPAAAPGSVALRVGQVRRWWAAEVGA